MTSNATRSIMTSDIIETERLVLRKFTLQDSEFILELLNTEGWIKYIGDRNVTTTDDARTYLENGPLQTYSNNLFGLRLVQLKTDNGPIGMCGLVKRNYLDHFDLGFALLPNYTGHGYGFEIATKVVEYAFDSLEEQKILAITLPANFSSISLLRKMGFAYDRNFIVPDTNEELSVYSISKENYHGQKLTHWRRN